MQNEYMARKLEYIETHERTLLRAETKRLREMTSAQLEMSRESWQAGKPSQGSGMLQLNQHNLQGNITDVLAESGELLKRRDEARAADQAKKVKQAKDKAEKKALVIAYIRCSGPGAVCSCEQNPCVVHVWKWCEGCDEKGKHPLTKGGCNKKDCPANAPSPSLTAMEPA